MTKTLDVIYDGEVFKPEQTISLAPNRKYRITVDSEPIVSGMGEKNAWDVLESLTGSIEAPEDWAEQHDHYLYGTPKHGNNPS